MKEITVFEASDGSLHRTKQAYNDHQKWLNHQALESKVTDFIEVKCPGLDDLIASYIGDYDVFVSFLLTNTTELKKLIEFIEKNKPSDL